MESEVRIEIQYKRTGSKDKWAPVLGTPPASENIAREAVKKLKDKAGQYDYRIVRFTTTREVLC